MAKLVRVRCVETTTDSRYNYYVKGREYTVPSDHPCMRWFEKLETVRESDFEEEQREVERKRKANRDEIEAAEDPAPARGPSRRR